MQGNTSTQHALSSGYDMEDEVVQVQVSTKADHGMYLHPPFCSTASAWSLWQSTMPHLLRYAYDYGVPLAPRLSQCQDNQFRFTKADQVQSGTMPRNGHHSSSGNYKEKKAELYHS